MKRRVFWKILTMALVLSTALTLVACGNDNGNGGSSASLGANPTITGQVFTASGGSTWCDDTDEWAWTPIVLTPFGGDRNVVGVIWHWDSATDTETRHEVGTGTIRGGQLSFNPGTPPPAALRSVADFAEEGISASPSNARFAQLWELELENGNGEVERWNSTRAQNGMSGTWEGVVYIYVDRDVTLSSRRQVFTEVEDGFTYTGILEAVNISLRQGWNVLHSRETWTETENSETWTSTISAGDPSHVRWILEEWGGHSAAIEALGQEAERPVRAFRARAH